jgi:hypothetical protein
MVQNHSNIITTIPLSLSFIDYEELTTDGMFYHLKNELMINGVIIGYPM